MPQMITVVVPTRDPGPALAALVAGLDAQTVRADDFEVVVADGGSTDGSLARLQRLSRSRPNLVVLPDATLADAVAAATGSHVLVLDQECRLLPEALARLAAAGRDGAVDVVAGRRRQGRGGYAGPLGGSADGAVPDPAELADAVLLVRRELLAGVLAGRDDDAGDWAPQVLAGAAEIATVPDHACGWTDGPALDAPLALDPASLTWTGTVLRLEVTVTPSEDGGEHLLVLDRADGVEIVLPTTAAALPALTPAVEPDPAAEGTAPSPAGSPRLRLTAELDCAAATAPAEGVYQVRVQRSGRAGGAVGVPADGSAPALLSGRPVLAHAVAGELQVDVGATASSLLTSLPTAGTVTETARGSLLQVPLPDLHVDGPGRLTGTLALGGLQLPAEVLAEETGQGWAGELRCYVSGLEGRSRLGTRFGGGSVVRTGVDLVMSHLGTFSLEPTPPPAEPEPARAPASRAGGAGKRKKKKQKARRPPTRLERLRRGVPPWLEPAVRPVAALPPARALYRRLNRRLSRR